MAPPFHCLRDEVLDAARAELARVGAAGFMPAAVVAHFTGRGASRASLYRWAGCARAGGKASTQPCRVAPPPVPDPAPAPPAASPVLAELLRAALAAEIEQAAPNLVAGALRRLQGRAVQVDFGF